MIAVTIRSALEARRVRISRSGDEPDGRPPAHAAVASSLTTWRNSSISDGPPAGELVHGAGGQRGGEDRLVVGAVGQLEHRARALARRAR